MKKITELFCIIGVLVFVSCGSLPSPLEYDTPTTIENMEGDMASVEAKKYPHRVILHSTQSKLTPSQRQLLKDTKALSKILLRTFSFGIIMIVGGFAVSLLTQGLAQKIGTKHTLSLIHISEPTRPY